MMNKEMKILLNSLTLASIATFSLNLYAESYAESELKEMVGEMDDNADNKINFEEFYEESVTDNDDSFDRNKDGYITAGEVANEMTEDLVETVDEMNRLGVSEEDANKTIVKALSGLDKKSEAIIDAMDTDNDNLVEEDELKAYKRKQFATMDKNKDGVLSQADLRGSGKKSQYKGYPILLQ